MSIIFKFFRPFVNSGDGTEPKPLTNVKSLESKEDFNNFDLFDDNVVNNEDFDLLTLSSSFLKNEKCLFLAEIKACHS